MYVYCCEGNVTIRVKLCIPIIAAQFRIIQML